MKPLGSYNFALTLYPCGRAVGTISDLRKFGMALLPDENGASPLFEKAETLMEMYTPTKYFSDGVTVQNRHGFWPYPTLQNNVIGHNGGTLGCSSNLLIDPANSVGVVVMTNQYGEQVYNSKMIREIFGKKDDVRIKENLPEDDGVTGIYYGTRGIRKGILRFGGILNQLFVTKNKDGGISVSGLPLISSDKLQLEQVGPGIYRLTEGDESELVYANKDSSGKIRSLSEGSVDFVRRSRAACIFDVFLLLSFIVAGIYGLVTLVIMLIRKLRKRDQPMGALRAAVCTAALAAVINIVVMAVMPAVSGTPGTVLNSTLVTHGILSILFALVPVACTVILAIKFKRPDADKKQKCQLISSAVMGLLMTFSVVFLQLWYFWA
jgi:hypothetical protein